MKLADRYDKVRESFTIAGVNIVCGGIKLFSVAELEGSQVGYSVAPDGVLV